MKAVMVVDWTKWGSSYNGPPPSYEVQSKSKELNNKLDSAYSSQHRPTDSRPKLQPGITIASFEPWPHYFLISLKTSCPLREFISNAEFGVKTILQETLTELFTAAVNRARALQSLVPLKVPAKKAVSESFSLKCILSVHAGY